MVTLADDEVVDDVEALTARFAQDRPEGLQAWVTGPAGSTADPVAGFERILFMLVLGAATDYSLLCTARYRDSLLHQRRRADATRAALRGTTEPVLAPVLLLLTTVVSCFTAPGVAVLAVIPIMVLAQPAFIVAFGVLLDALVVRSLLVPAPTYDLGRVIRWRLRRRVGP